MERNFRLRQQQRVVPVPEDADVLCHARASKMFGLFGLTMADLCQVAQL